MENNQIRILFEDIQKAASEPTNEPTSTAKAIGSIEAYAKVGLNMIRESNKDLEKELKAYESENRSRVKIVVYLVINGETECQTFDGKLPFENATLQELKEAQRILRKKLKQNK